MPLSDFYHSHTLLLAAKFRDLVALIGAGVLRGIFRTRSSQPAVAINCEVPDGSIK
jgi:hypothetical protein